MHSFPHCLCASVGSVLRFPESPSSLLSFPLPLPLPSSGSPCPACISVAIYLSSCSIFSQLILHSATRGIFASQITALVKKNKQKYLKNSPHLDSFQDFLKSYLNLE